MTNDEQLTQVKPLWLSEELGKDKSTVSHWCTNDMQSSFETFYEIAKLLDIDVRDLFVSSKN